jgi:release factor glutamine methyltransferase
LLLEHGYTQAEAIRQLMQDAGLTAIQSHADLAGIIRVTEGRLGA